MRNTLSISALLLSPVLLGAALTVAAQPAPVVEVAFDKPEGFVDVYPRGRTGTERELNETLDSVRQIFAEQAARHLKPGDRLKVTVTELDLAGEIEPGRSGILELRVLRRITWPSMTLRYTLTRDGQQTSAEAKLSDPGYQDNSGACARAGGLCYEKLMVGRWLQRQFG